MDDFVIRELHQPWLLEKIEEDGVRVVNTYDNKTAAVAEMVVQYQKDPGWYTVYSSEVISLVPRPGKAK